VFVVSAFCCEHHQESLYFDAVVIIASSFTVLGVFAAALRGATPYGDRACMCQVKAMRAVHAMVN